MPIFLKLIYSIIGAHIQPLNRTFFHSDKMILKLILNNKQMKITMNVLKEKIIKGERSRSQLCQILEHILKQQLKLLNTSAKIEIEQRNKVGTQETDLTTFEDSVCDKTIHFPQIKREVNYLINHVGKPHNSWHNIIHLSKYTPDGLTNYIFKKKSNCREITKNRTN